MFSFVGIFLDYSSVGDRQTLASKRQIKWGTCSYLKFTLLYFLEYVYLLMLVAKTYKHFAFQLSVNMDKIKTWLDEKEAEQKK